ncbi:hypothetical protein RFI_26900, partial [Reticulomyxa filosa]
MALEIQAYHSQLPTSSSGLSGPLQLISPHSRQKKGRAELDSDSDSEKNAMDDFASPRSDNNERATKPELNRQSSKTHELFQQSTSNEVKDSTDAGAGTGTGALPPKYFRRESRQFQKKTGFTPKNTPINPVNSVNLANNGSQGHIKSSSTDSIFNRADHDNFQSDESNTNHPVHRKQSRSQQDIDFAPYGYVPIQNSIFETTNRKTWIPPPPKDPPPDWALNRQNQLKIAAMQVKSETTSRAAYYGRADNTSNEVGSPPPPPPSYPPPTIHVATTKSEIKPKNKKVASQQKAKPKAKARKSKLSNDMTVAAPTKPLPLPPMAKDSKASKGKLVETETKLHRIHPPNASRSSEATP